MTRICRRTRRLFFDAVDTLELCLRTVTPMLATMTSLPANMRRAAAKGFINATDCADYLTKGDAPSAMPTSAPARWWLPAFARARRWKS